MFRDLITIIHFVAQEAEAAGSSSSVGVGIAGTALVTSFAADAMSGGHLSGMCVYVCTNVCMCVCVYVRTYVCMYVHMYVCMYVCMHVCMYVRMYACMLQQLVSLFRLHPLVY